MLLHISIKSFKTFPVSEYLEQDMFDIDLMTLYKSIVLCDFFSLPSRGMDKSQLRQNPADLLNKSPLDIIPLDKSLLLNWAGGQKPTSYKISLKIY